MPSNKGMKLTSVEHIGRLQLIPGVGPTVQMSARAAESRCLRLALILSLVSCASAPTRLSLREWPGGSFNYVVADPPVYLSVSRETGERVGLSETERYLIDLAQRLKTHIGSLEARGLVPASCIINAQLLREPAVACVGRFGGPTAEALEALLRVTIVSPSQRPGAVQDVEIRLEIGSRNAR